jgi:hypothetical protein
VCAVACHRPFPRGTKKASTHGNLRGGQNVPVTSRSLLAVLVSAIVLAGCGGSSDRSVASNVTSSSAPAAVPQAGLTAGPDTTPSSAASHVPALSSGGATSRPTAAAPAQRPATAGARTSIAPGTYTYDDSGTVTAGTPHDASGTSTFVVDPPADGKQHSKQGDDRGSTEQDVVVRPGGLYLARLLISNPSFTKDFHPAEPVILAPTPATPGRTWSWTLKSTDGKTTASVSARVVRQETVRIGGEQIATSVVESTMRLTGDISYTQQMQSWFDQAHLLSVKEHSKGSGTVSGFQFTTDITRVMRSVHPAS